MQRNTNRFRPENVGGKVKDYLLEEHIKISAAPPRQQHKNGLVERKYQTIFKMTRNWLTSSLLPSNYWWLAMKWAVEVSNMLPTLHTTTTTPVSPHELFYQQKPDLRTLVPMFAVAYVTQPTISKSHSNAIKCICVGRGSKSNGILFYHPPTKRIFTDGNIAKFDFTLPSGPQFQEKYDGSFTFTSKADLDSILHRPLPFNNEDQVFAIHPTTNYLTPGTIIQAPFDPTTDPFSLKFSDGTLSQNMTDSIQDNDPSTAITETSDQPNNPLLHWIKHDAKVTFTHPSLGPKPK